MKYPITIFQNQNSPCLGTIKIENITFSRYILIIFSCQKKNECFKYWPIETIKCFIHRFEKHGIEINSFLEVGGERFLLLDSLKEARCDAAHPPKPLYLQYNKQLNILNVLI